MSHLTAYNPTNLSPIPVEERFTLIEQIGETELGPIYLARDNSYGPSLGSLTVTLTLRLIDRVGLDDEQCGALRRAFTDSREVTHPNITPIFELLEYPRWFAISTQTVHGVSLEELLVHYTLPARLILSIISQTAEALDTLHRAGRAHGGVAGGEIALSPDGRISLNILTTRRLLSGVNTVREGDADREGDLSALGILAHRCLYGFAPEFTSDGAITLATRLRRRVTLGGWKPRLSALRTLIDKLIDRRDPHAIRSCHDLRREIRAVAEGAALSVPPHPVELPGREGSDIVPHSPRISVALFITGVAAYCAVVLGVLGALSP